MNQTMTGERPYCLLSLDQPHAHPRQVGSTAALYQHLDELFDAPDLERQTAFARQVEACSKAQQRVVWNVGCTYALPLDVLGEDEFFIRVITEPESMQELCMRYAMRKADAIVQTLQVMRRRPEVLLFADPFGKDDLPQIRPNVFRSRLKQAQQFLVRRIKRAYPEMRIWYRCCASSYPLVADFAEIGFDAWIPCGRTEQYAGELADCRAFMQGELEVFSVSERQWDSWKRGQTACAMRAI